MDYAVICKVCKKAGIKGDDDSWDRVACERVAAHVLAGKVIEVICEACLKMEEINETGLYIRCGKSLLKT